MTDTALVDLRPATPEDALDLAKLIDIAGEGIPNWLWSQNAGPGETALDVGAARARRETGGFSYRNALVATLDKRPVGMMLGYPVGEATDEDRAAVPDLPEPIRPFVELEFESAGTYYVNAVAVRPGLRGQGIGMRLLSAAESNARALGLTRMSIQVFSQNTLAVQLYQRANYLVVAHRPVLLHPCQPYYDEDVLLLMKEIG